MSSTPKTPTTATVSGRQIGKDRGPAPASRRRRDRNSPMQKSSNSFIQIWPMPLTNHPDPVVRGAFREFRSIKTTYSVGDAIESVKKRLRQINGTSPNAQAVYDASGEDV